MKIALCFSGNIRDLNETKNFWSELIKKYDIDAIYSIIKIYPNLKQTRFEIHYIFLI